MNANALKMTEEQGEVSILSLDTIQIEEGHNPRRFRSKKRIAEMRESIQREGVLQPILVRPNPTGNGYLVVAGQTRYDLAKEVGHTTIPALIKMLSDDEARTAALVENVQRVDMSPLDEGVAARAELIRHKNDVAEVLKILGWSRKKLDSRILLTHASDLVAQALCDEEIQLGHAELLCGMRPEKQDAALKWVVDQKVTVMALKEKIESLTLHLNTAIFDTAGCNGCQHNTSVQTNLFDTGMEKARCLNGACFQGKVDAHLKQIVADQGEKYPVVKLDNQIAAETFTTLEIEGAKGVGKAQYAACQSCEHFGAIVRTGLGCVGQVESEQCFNLTCHAEKVKANLARVASEKAAAAKPKAAIAVAAQRTSTQNIENVDEASVPANVASSVSVEAETKADSLPQKLIDFHHQVHRAAASALVRQDMVLAKALAVVALMKDGEIKLNQTPKGWPVSLVGEGRGQALSILSRLPEDRLDTMLSEMAARSVQSSKTNYGNDKQPERETFGSAAITVLNLREHDLCKHFTISIEYLDMLTKGAIKTILEASGFAADYEQTKGSKTFPKLMGLKKPEILEAVKASGFNFAGYLPPHLSIGA